jgi:oligosaccharide repeat unit polymerase
VLTYLIFIFFWLLICRSTLSRFIILLIASSVFSGLLIGIPLDFFDAKTNINSLFSCGIISFFLLGFNSSASLTPKHGRQNYINSKVIKAFVSLSCVAVVINIYILLNSLFEILAVGMMVGEFKNGGYGEDFISNKFPSFLITLSYAVSPISYFCLAAHFYFLVVADKRMASLCFIGSLNIVILPLVYFARGGIVIYILLYFAMLAYVYRYLNDYTRKKINFRVIAGFSPLIFVFMIITFNRFGDDYAYFRDGTLVTNPAVYALLDYFSQWLVVGNTLIDNFDDEKIMYGSSANYLPGKLLGIFGFSFPVLQDLRQLHFGDNWNSFHGLPGLILYDFGYYFSFLLAFLFMVTVRFLLAGRRHLLHRLSWLAVLLPVTLYFFQGLFTVYGFYNLAILYAVLLSVGLRLRYRRS